MVKYSAIPRLLFGLAIGSALLMADDMKFTSVGNPADAYYGNYFVSPYIGTDLTTNRTNILLYCLDFNHEVFDQETWTASLGAVPTSGPNSSYQYGTTPISSFVTSVDGFTTGTANLTDLQRYQLAGHLFDTEINLPSLTDRQRAVYQYAVWEVFLEDSSKSNFTNSFNQIIGADASFGTDVQNTLTTALGSYDSPSSLSSLAQHWSVVSPVPAGQASSVQEFLTPSLSSVPEPSAIVLLATTAAALWFGNRRRNRFA